MPNVWVPRYDDNMTQEDLLTSLGRMSRSLEYNLSHLDSENIDRVYFEDTLVRSKYGETIFSGPELLMYGTPSTTIGSSSPGLLHLRAGYSTAVSNFQFKMWSTHGTTTIQVTAAGSITLRPGSTAQSIDVGAAGSYTNILGYFAHTGNRIGFFGTTPVTKTAVSTATSTTVDLLNTKLNELISALNTYGIV